MANLPQNIEGELPSPEDELSKIASFDDIDYEVIDQIFQVKEKSLSAIAVAAGRDPGTFFIGRDFSSKSLRGIDVRKVSLNNSDLRNTNLRASIIDSTTNLSGAILDLEDRHALTRRGILHTSAPKLLISYRIFIASPGGLEDERREAYKVIRRFSERHAVPRGVHFNPIGWEDTLPGHGRPQALINEDIITSDYVIFIFHDRWGSPTGKSEMTGVEEEFELAEELYDALTLRNIVLLFKTVDVKHMEDPGPQLQRVLDFKKTIEAQKRHLFKPFDGLNDFGETIEACLAHWLRDHESKGALSADVAQSGPTTPAKTPAAAPPDWAYWITEAKRLEAEADPDRAAILYCRTQAARTATSDAEWLEAEHGRGNTLADVGRLSEALAAFQAVQDRATASAEPGQTDWSAWALFNKGATLATLGRADEEIATYDDVVARFAATTEPAVRELVAEALINKGVALGTLGRTDEAVATYDDVVARFAAATEPALRKQVAKALVNKGVALGTLGRADEKIATYDDVVARFVAATEPGIREPVATALLYKAITLRDLDRSEEAITVLEDCLVRFDGSSDPAVEERLEDARELLDKLRTKPTRKRKR